jgi:UDP-N-acetylmuramoyl-tripeptide--D-alanyl-D-alanine ligase
MIDLSITQLADIVSGTVVAKPDLANDIISSVSTDSREIDSNGLFVALIGERFDAHDFCDVAIKNGAKALLVSKPVDTQITQIVVDDTQKALGKLGAWVFECSKIPSVALTGSCGKTTVKEMLASILQLKGKVLATLGNFNNEIGVPLTLLRANSSYDFAVIELGANHIGEIAYTTELVKPDIALVNNIAAAHLEGFGSIEGVKQAKGEIYQGLKKGSRALFNLDSNGGEAWHKHLDDKLVQTFSFNNSLAEYYASNVTIDANGYPSFRLHSPYGITEITLSIIGQHNVNNAVAAAAIAFNFGLSLPEIKQGLQSLAAVKGRVDVEQLTDSIRLIDDSYNASVPAMEAAVKLLSEYQGVRWLILGYMAELGEESLALHRQVGDYAATFGFEFVLTYGADTKIISKLCDGIHFDTHQQMVEFIDSHLTTHSEQTHTLLVKGANSAKMSSIVAALKEKHQ